MSFVQPLLHQHPPPVVPPVILVGSAGLLHQEARDVGVFDAPVRLGDLVEEIHLCDVRELGWCDFELNVEIGEDVDWDEVLGGDETGSTAAGFGRERVRVDCDVAAGELGLEEVVVVLIAEGVEHLVGIFDGEFVDRGVVEAGSLDGTV